MATVGNLNINVNARTSRFNKKMQGVRASVGRLAAGFVNIAKKVALFGAAIAAVGLGALVAMTKAGLASVDMVTKLAKAMNTGAEGIITLQHAAKLGGVSVEKMDKAIGKMFKNVGEAQTGLGMAKASLDKLGLSADALGKMEADEMFGTISEAISGMSDATERAFHANAILGRAGLELIPVMLGGAAGIKELREEADLLGITFGTEQGQLVEQANDAWARIGSVWKGLTQQLAIGFAPVLTEIANRLKNMIIGMGGMKQVADFIVRAFFMAGAAIMDMLKGVEVFWLGLKASIIGGAGSIASAIGELVGGDLALIGQALQDEAAGIGQQINDKLAEGWSLSGVDDYIEGLRKKFTKADPVAMAVEAAVTVADTAATAGQTGTESISTALGAFKVEGDTQERIAQQQVDHLSSIDDGIAEWNAERERFLESLGPMKPIESDVFLGDAPDTGVDWNDVAE